MSVHISSACKKLEYRGAKREVLLEFADHANDDGICWPSRGRIMYNTGLSESAVKQQMKELRDAGVLVVVDQHEGGRGKVPIYKVCPEKGPQKTPFSEWCKQHGKGSKGSPDNPQRGHEVTPEPSLEPSVNPPKGGATQGLAADTFVSFLAEELDGADVPYTDGWRGRHGKQFKECIKKGVPESTLYKASDRIVERWTGESHAKLTIENALQDVVNGKAPAHVEGRHSKPPPWEPVNPHSPKPPMDPAAYEREKKRREEVAAMLRSVS